MAWNLAKSGYALLIRKYPSSRPADTCLKRLSANRMPFPPHSHRGHPVYAYAFAVCDVWDPSQEGLVYPWTEPV